MCRGCSGCRRSVRRAARRTAVRRRCWEEPSASCSQAMFTTAAPSGNVFPVRDMMSMPRRAAVEPVGRVVVDVEVGQVLVRVPGSEGVVVGLDSRAASRRILRPAECSPTRTRYTDRVLSSAAYRAVVDVELLAEGERARAQLIGVVGAGKGSCFGEFFEGVEPIVRAAVGPSSPRSLRSGSVGPGRCGRRGGGRGRVRSSPGRHLGCRRVWA